MRFAPRWQRTARLASIPAAALLCCVAGPGPAHAALGEPLASVQADGARMKAAVRVQAASGYSVHQIQDANGTVVREFATPAGVVFAVDWRGPFKPDLAALLGRSFPAYASAPRSVGSDRNHLAIDTDALVVRAGGRQRGFFGRAWVPALVPAGLDAAVLP